MTEIPEPFRRPRGRPKGWRAPPKTFEGFIADSLKRGATPPAQPERPKAKPRGPMAHMTPEQRSEYAKAMRSKVRAENLSRPSPLAGVPRGWSSDAFADAQATARQDAERFLVGMEKHGLELDDDIAREATLTVLTLMRQPGTRKEKHALARTILEYFQPRPAVAANVRSATTAEALIDALTACESVVSTPG